MILDLDTSEKKILKLSEWMLKNPETTQPRFLSVFYDMQGIGTIEAPPKNSSIMGRIISTRQVIAFSRNLH